MRFPLYTSSILRACTSDVEIVPIGPKCPLQGAALVAVRILRANKKFDHTFHVRCLRTAFDFYLISLKVQK